MGKPQGALRMVISLVVVGLVVMTMSGCDSAGAGGGGGGSDPETYMVSYEANGATSGTAPVEQTKIEGVDLTLSSNTGNLARTGYTFSGWNTAADGSGTRYSEGAAYTDDAALSLFAEWTNLPTYTISYDANGATSGTAPGEQTKIEGIDLTLSSNTGNLALTGYTFSGWNTAADGNGTDYAESAAYTVDADLTMYAKWTQLPTYTISYHANDATLGTVPTSQTKTHGTDLVLASNTGELKRTEYIFDGWNTASDGSGTDYVKGGTFTPDEDTTLYVKWRHIGLYPQIVAVSFDGPSTIDTSGGDQVVTFTVEAEDDMALALANVAIQGPSGTFASKSIYIPSAEYSGTATSGTFTFEVTIPQFSEFGTWTLTQVQVADHLSRYTSLGSTDLANAGWSYTIEQTGAGDTVAPTISAVTFDGPSTIDTSGGDQVVTFTVEAEDDMALDRAFVAVQGPSGTVASKSVYIPSAEYSGTATSGTFTFEVTIPQFSESGTWTLTDVQVVDHIPRYTSLYSTDLADAGWSYTFEQTGAGDTVAPTISAVTFDGPSTIDTSAGDQVVTFTVEAEDDIALDRAYVAVRGPSGTFASKSVYIPSAEYSGTATSGTFTFEVTIPQFAESGTWTLTDVQVADHIPRYTSLYSTDLADAGWSYTFQNE